MKVLGLIFILFFCASLRADYGFYSPLDKKMPPVIGEKVVPGIVRALIYEDTADLLEPQEFDDYVNKMTDSPFVQSYHRKFKDQYFKNSKVVSYYPLGSCSSFFIQSPKNPKNIYLITASHCLDFAYPVASFIKKYRASAPADDQKRAAYFQARMRELKKTTVRIRLYNENGDVIYSGFSLEKRLPVLFLGTGPIFLDWLKFTKIAPFKDLKYPSKVTEKGLAWAQELLESAGDMAILKMPELPKGYKGLTFPESSKTVQTYKESYVVGFPTKTTDREGVSYPDSNGLSLYATKGREIDSDLKAQEILDHMDLPGSMVNFAKDFGDYCLQAHTADIVRGNSGGPILNEKGEVTGLVSRGSLKVRPKEGPKSYGVRFPLIQAYIEDLENGWDL